MLPAATQFALTVVEPMMFGLPGGATRQNQLACRSYMLDGISAAATSG